MLLGSHCINSHKFITHLLIKPIWLSIRFGFGSRLIWLWLLANNWLGCNSRCAEFVTWPIGTWLFWIAVRTIPGAEFSAFFQRVSLLAHCIKMQIRLLFSISDFFFVFSLFQQYFFLLIEIFSRHFRANREDEFESINNFLSSSFRHRTMAKQTFWFMHPNESWLVCFFFWLR